MEYVKAITWIMAAQTVWMIWRDLKIIKHQKNIKGLTDHFDNRAKVLHDNYDTAKSDAEQWRLKALSLAKEQAAREALDAEQKEPAE